MRRRRNPRLVVGFGGFVTGPRRHRRVAHAPSAADPRTERDRGLLQPHARAARAAGAVRHFRDAFPPGIDAQVVGNPVRAEIALQPSPAERFAPREGALRLLVVGGSLGAARLNAVVPFAVKRERSRSFACGTRRASAASTRRAPRTRQAGVDARRRAVHRRHGARPTLARTSWSAARARSRSPSSPPSASARCSCRSRPRSTITRRFNAQLPRARRRGRADRGARAHRRAARRRRSRSCAPVAASCSRWPSARASSRGRAPQRSSPPSCLEELVHGQRGAA